MIETKRIVFIWTKDRLSIRTKVRIKAIATMTVNSNEKQHYKRDCASYLAKP